MGSQYRDMRNQILHNHNTAITIIYNSPYELNIPPRSEMRVKVPTNFECGDAILNFLQFKDGVCMPTALIKCDNFFAHTIIQNNSDSEATITLKKT